MKTVNFPRLQEANIYEDLESVLGEVRAEISEEINKAVSSRFDNTDDDWPGPPTRFVDDVYEREELEREIAADKKAFREKLEAQMEKDMEDLATRTGGDYRRRERILAAVSRSDKIMGKVKVREYCRQTK